MLEKFAIDLSALTTTSRLKVRGRFPNDKCASAQDGAVDAIRQIGAMLDDAALKKAIESLQAISLHRAENGPDTVEVGQTLYGASGCFYSGSSHGRATSAGPCKQVREFIVTGETSRSWVLDGRHKVSKNKMLFDAGSFTIQFFCSYSEAVNSLRATAKS